MARDVNLEEIDVPRNEVLSHNKLWKKHLFCEGNFFQDYKKWSRLFLIFSLVMYKLLLDTDLHNGK